MDLQKMKPANDVASVDLLGMATDIVAAYVSNHAADFGDVPNMIRQVYGCLSQINTGGTYAGERPDPAVSVKKSVQDDYIVCLEDGRKLKMLKRHLKTAYNMTPEQYRERWNLPSDYPMVAPNYARRRSSLALEIGLGRKRKEEQSAA